jgi:hypothetical protein
MRAAAAARFVAHYVEMVVAMAAGMLVLHPAWTVAIAATTPTSVLRSIEVDTLVMATAMSVPMVAWMRHRGHGWVPAAEMSLAMYAGFVVLYPLMWAGVVSDAEVMSYGHVLMLGFMLLAMLWRRHEYTTTHHDHHRVGIEEFSDSVPARSAS